MFRFFSLSCVVSAHKWDFSTYLLLRSMLIYICQGWYVFPVYFGSLVEI